MATHLGRHKDIQHTEDRLCFERLILKCAMFKNPGPVPSVLSGGTASLGFAPHHRYQSNQIIYYDSFLPRQDKHRPQEYIYLTGDCTGNALELRLHSLKSTEENVQQGIERNGSHFISTSYFHNNYEGKKLIMRTGTAKYQSITFSYGVSAFLPKT